MPSKGSNLAKLIVFGYNSSNLERLTRPPGIEVPRDLSCVTSFFRVARLDEGVQTSVPFYPKVQGFTRKGAEYPREGLLMKEEALAGGIVCAFDNMGRDG